MSGLVGLVSRREFLRVVGAVGASTLSPLTASAQYRELEFPVLENKFFIL